MSSVRVASSGAIFEVQEGQSILEAALEHDIHLEYGCSNGRCGRCKATLVEGSVEDSFDGVSVETLANEILTCCAKPTTDLIIDVECYQELSGISRKTFVSKVDSIELVNSSVLKVILRMPKSAGFRFVPGQYIDVNLNGDKRSYSIAGFDKSQNKIELHLKNYEGGVFSHYFFNELKIDQLIRFFGPNGTFFFRKSESGPLVFLCTGTGFAPVKSIIESLIESNHDERSIFIYWGGRYEEDIYSDLPFKWATENDWISFVPVLSRQTDSALPEVRFGYVQNVVIKAHESLVDAQVYACGSEDMIRDAHKVLTDHGLKATHYFSDAFLPSSESN